MSLKIFTSTSEMDDSKLASPSTPPSSKTDTAVTATAVKKGEPSAVDFEPPLACVRRILKNTLPGSTHFGKDASAAFARASGIFIIYLTACANDFAREHKRQTITANDVLAAIKELDFDEFSPTLTEFLDSYRKAEKSKKDAKAAAAIQKGEEDEEEEDDEEDETATTVRCSGTTKRAREDESAEHDEEDHYEDISASPQDVKRSKIVHNGEVES